MHISSSIHTYALYIPRYIYPIPPKFENISYPIYSIKEKKMSSEKKVVVMEQLGCLFLNVVKDFTSDDEFIKHLSAKLGKKESKIKEALESFDWDCISTDLKNAKNKTVKPKSSSSSKKSKSISERVATALANDKFFNVDCGQYGRTQGRSDQQDAKYAYYSCGVAGKYKSEKLIAALKELGCSNDKPLNKKIIQISEGSKKKKDVAKPKTKNGFAPVLNEFENYWDPDTKIVFDPVEKDVAMGYQHKEGNVLPLKEKHINICKEKDWKFKECDETEVTKSVIAGEQKVDEDIEEFEKQQKKSDDETEEEKEEKPKTKKHKKSKKPRSDDDDDDE